MCIAAVSADAVSLRSSCSITTRWAISSTASTAEALALAQRASWFRLLPMRTTWRMRLRSASVAARSRCAPAPGLPQQVGQRHASGHGGERMVCGHVGRGDRPLREVIEAALAHVVQNKVEAAYGHSDVFERRRLLVDDWGAYLDG